MNSFEYIVPDNIDRACSFLAGKSESTKILAGGTDLLINLKKGFEKPRHLLDIMGLKELRQIEDLGDSVFIGSAVTMTEIGDSDIIRRCTPFLCQAARSIGSPQIRNAATIGGNLINASPCADTMPPLMALECAAKIRNAEREDELKLEDLIIEPYQTVLSLKEILVGLSFRKLPRGSGTSFLKVGRRRAMAIAVVSIAVSVAISDDGRISEARIAPGSLLPVPSRLRNTEEALMTEPPSEGLFERVGGLAAEEAFAIVGTRLSTPYKKPVFAALVKQALSEAVQRCEAL
jgi:CO/xanthine dehydrogenase FAD-binding subunit